MATKYLAPSPKFRATDQNGVPLSGGFVYAYAAGTTTLGDTYSDSSGTLNDSPIVLDSRGECDLFLTQGVKYDLHVQNSAGVLQFTATRVAGSVTPSSYMATLMQQTSLSGTFSATIGQGGTFTATLQMEDAAINYAADVSLYGTPTTAIGAAASNNVTINNPPTQLTWTARTSAEDNQWRGIAWSPSLALFAAIALDGTNRVMTSPNGVTWTARSAAAANQWDAIVWAAELSLFVAVSITGTGNRVMTSPDGITWTSRTSSNDYQWACIGWNGTRLVCGEVSSGSGDQVMSSTDGISWTTYTVGFSQMYMTGCAYSSSLGLWAGCGSAGLIGTSVDGNTTWTQRANDSGGGTVWRSICWSPELSLFVAVADLGTVRVKTSPDGITWTTRAAASTAPWFNVVWAPEISLFISTAYDGSAMTSLDGVTWTLNATPNGNFWHGLAWSPSLLLAAAVSLTGTGNRVMTGVGA